MSIARELSCDGVLPTGPVSAWPKERHDEITAKYSAKSQQKPTPTIGSMARGIVKTGAQAIRHGKVSSEIREERYDTCKQCPFFDAESKRCTDCGCFMEAKTWVGGDPDQLCPQKKWSR
jgi:hypothetical protein